MQNEDLQNRLATALKDADGLWGDHKLEIASQADDWFRQHGIINESVINNTIAYLLCAVRGIKDVAFDVNLECRKINFAFAVRWWTYYFKRKATLNIWGPILSANFPTYDINLVIYKYKKGWDHTIKSDYEEIDKRTSQERSQKPPRNQTSHNQK